MVGCGKRTIMTITHIKLKVADKELELTLEDARTLHEELSKLFPTTQPQLIPYSPPLPSHPTFPNTQPMFPNPFPTPAVDPWWGPRWTTWCGDNSPHDGTVCLLIGNNQ